jgi:CSLREA domain-containing protein
MQTYLQSANKHKQLANKWAKGVGQLLLVISLLAPPAAVHAQAPVNTVDERPHVTFLPMISLDDRSGAQASDFAAKQEFPLTPEELEAEYVAILEAPAPEEIRSADANGVTYQVNKTQDSADGVCSPDDCSLREAMAMAASTPATHDVIKIPAGVYKITLGPLNLVNASLIGAGTKNTLIDGGAFDEPNGIDYPQGIIIPPVAEADTWNTIEQLKLGLFAQSYCIDHQEGVLTVKNVIFLACENAEIRSSNLDGASADELAIYNTVFYGNGFYGIIAIGTPSRMDNSVIRGNDVSIYLAHTVFTMTGSAILRSGDNSLEILNSVVTLRNSLVSNYRYFGIYAKDSQIELTNSTMSGRNTAPELSTAIYVESKAATSSVRLNFVTITNNGGFEKFDPNIPGDKAYPGAIYMPLGDHSQVFLRNSILANSGPTRINNAAQMPDCAGTIISEGYNLIENPTRCNIIGDMTGNIMGVDPQLGPLAYNGSGKIQTQNHLPKASSPVVDVIPAERCSAHSIDQRYLNRPRDGNGDHITLCDIGAIER